MKEKIKIFEIKDNFAKIYVRIPRFAKFKDFYKEIDQKYKKINKTEDEKYIGAFIDETGKYLIVYFALRNDDEYSLYLQLHNEEKTLLLQVLDEMNHENENLKSENKRLKELIKYIDSNNYVDMKNANFNGILK